MEEALLLKNQDRRFVPTPKAFVEELKKVTAIAAPMVVVTMVQYLLHVAPMIMLGAYGAEQYRKLGTYTYGAILSLILVCLPISLLWIFMDKLLVFFGQDPIVSLEASKYAICLIPSLFPCAILESMAPYLRTQSLILPMLLCSIVTLSFHIPLCWALVFKSGTRVSNELGAGNSRAAQLSVCTVMVLAVAEAIMVSAALFCCRSILGYAYSGAKEVVDYVREMTPLLCLSIIMDSLSAILSGIARGSGWQHIDAYVNFAAYYLVGIPLAFAMGFFQNLRGEGIWGRVVTGTILEVILLTSTTCLSNWQEQANKARERIFKGRIRADKLIDQLN
ncbi:hypothetical protein RHSIM_RhsimUnG0202200 [Rhododendron simsii]|uniref:MATE efflux family protein n=1 Tax=Rhododendron simsii TaxID=118357 RepID=A0A834FVS3_RHOSS|nr:hypothetical protein RHSIM_RhsimUnG0202200 [Rhododendron simsii]